MLTPDEDSDISALAANGWSMSAIARHLSVAIAKCPLVAILLPTSAQ